MGSIFISLLMSCKTIKSKNPGSQVKTTTTTLPADAKAVAQLYFEALSAPDNSGNTYLDKATTNYNNKNYAKANAALFYFFAHPKEFNTIKGWCDSKVTANPKVPSIIDSCIIIYGLNRAPLSSQLNTFVNATPGSDLSKWVKYRADRSKPGFGSDYSAIIDTLDTAGGPPSFEKALIKTSMVIDSQALISSQGDKADITPLVDHMTAKFETLKNKANKSLEDHLDIIRCLLFFSNTMFGDYSKDHKVSQYFNHLKWKSIGDKVLGPFYDVYSGFADIYKTEIVKAMDTINNSIKQVWPAEPAPYTNKDPEAFYVASLIPEDILQDPMFEEFFPDQKLPKDIKTTRRYQLYYHPHFLFWDVAKNWVKLVEDIGKDANADYKAPMLIILAANKYLKDRANYSALHIHKVKPALHSDIAYKANNPIHEFADDTMVLSTIFHDKLALKLGCLDPNVEGFQPDFRRFWHCGPLEFFYETYLSPMIGTLQNEISDGIGELAAECQDDRETDAAIRNYCKVFDLVGVINDASMVFYFFNSVKEDGSDKSPFAIYSQYLSKLKKDNYMSLYKKDAVLTGSADHKRSVSMKFLCVRYLAKHIDSDLMGRMFLPDDKTSMNVYFFSRLYYGVAHMDDASLINNDYKYVTDNKNPDYEDYCTEGLSDSPAGEKLSVVIKKYSNDFRKTHFIRF